MYKVFFNDRTVFFGDDFSKAFQRNKGLFYKFNNFQELYDLVDLFASLKQIQSLYIFHTDMLLLVEEFKACFTIVEAAGGLVFNDTGEFLVIERKGVWDLPKGKLEKGEGFENAALREVEEETGLRNLVTVQPLLSTYHTYPLEGERILKKTRWFEMQYSGKQLPILQETEGITDFRWVQPGITDFIRKNTYKSILDVLFFREVL
jgi:8-oxo-dGTP pyrophosphatase MutT (NUDIX family)